jgi:uncharacterized membrane protein
MNPTTPPVIENIQAVTDLERRVLQDRTRLEQLTDRITDSAGSPWFIAVHVGLFAAWMWINTAVRSPFDPFPFTFLNLVVSLEAIVLTSFVLMTQTRMTRLADKRAHLDLQVNLLAEQELTTMLHMLDALCRRSGVRVSVADDRVAALLRNTDIHDIANRLDHALDRSPVSRENTPQE